MFNQRKKRKVIGKRISTAILVIVMLVMAIIPSAVLADSKETATVSPGALEELSNGGGAAAKLSRIWN
jgi:hypothetical protein